MSEIFTHKPDQFQDLLRELPYQLRFAEITKLSDAQKSALATDWRRPEHDNVFHKICLPGSKELYFVTDTLTSNSESNSNFSVFGLWEDEQSITHRFSQQAVIDAIKEADSTMAVFGLRRDGHYPQHSFSQPAVIDSIKESNQNHGKIITLDIGSGSGISAIIMQNYLWELEIAKYETIGVDLNPRAIDFGVRNTLLNNLPPITWKDEIYNLKSAPLKGCSVIQMNSPYNPRPDFLSKFTPKFADGWSEDATLNFKSQITIAHQHLAPNGIMVINMMSPNSIADPNKSLAVEFIQNLDPTLSIECLEIYEPIATGDFLNGTFDGIGENIRDVDPKRVRQIVEFQNRINQPQNKFHYNIIIVKNDGKGEFTRFTDHNFAQYDWNC
jgi:ribosomal protein L11 methylase PrmA